MYYTCILLLELIYLLINIPSVLYNTSDSRTATCTYAWSDITCHQLARIRNRWRSHVLRRECVAGRVVGPLNASCFPQVHTSRFGVIPKSNQPGRWRLILDLSAPDGFSANDGVDPELCSLLYHGGRCCGRDSPPGLWLAARKSRH